MKRWNSFRHWLRRLVCPHDGHEVTWKREGSVVHYDAKCTECGADIPLPDSAAEALMRSIGSAGKIIGRVDEDD